jgi:arginine-tRNA-protein transferase
MPEGHSRPTPPIAPIAPAARDAERERVFAAPPQQFYRTAAMPCPYVPGRVERKLVTELDGRDAASFYNALSRAGFRRSHNLAYRPACAGCAACLPVRIPVADFALTRSLKRIRNLNRDLRVRVSAPTATVEQYRLFLRYQRLRHTDSDMAAMTYGDYRAMVEDSPVATSMVELRDDPGALRGACLTDVLDDGLSAVYSFYDPEDGKRSLGNLLVLALVDEAVRRRLPYVYLGYLIAESPKMAYKARFRPLEALQPGGWRRIIG